MHTHDMPPEVITRGQTNQPAFDCCRIQHRVSVCICTNAVKAWYGSWYGCERGLRSVVCVNDDPHGKETCVLLGPAHHARKICSVLRPCAITVHFTMLYFSICCWPWFKDEKSEILVCQVEWHSRRKAPHIWCRSHRSAGFRLSGRFNPLA